MNIPKLIQLINTLPYNQKATLFDAIYPMVKNSSDNLNDYLKDIRESWFASKPHCPHCGGEHIVGHGKYRGRQRYKCKVCNRTFNDTTASPLAGTHYPEKWTQHIQLLLKGAVLKEVAETLEIHISTAFYWRHKVLSALNSIEPEELSGIIESDEKFFLESQKGKNQVQRHGKRDARKRGGVSQFRGISREQVCVLVAMDRNGHMVSKKAGYGRISAKKIDTTIGSYIPDDAILCTDSARNYIHFAKDKALKHYKVNGNKKQYVVDEIYHVQHVNSYHSRLEDWINRHFRGVATKYMDNYLSWHRFLELNRKLDRNALKKELLTTIIKPDKITTVGSLRPA